MSFRLADSPGLRVFTVMLAGGIADSHSTHSFPMMYPAVAPALQYSLVHTDHLCTLFLSGGGIQNTRKVSHDIWFFSFYLVASLRLANTNAVC
jgi:hypothetical protein